jgi:hypothetical protein
MLSDHLSDHQEGRYIIQSAIRRAYVAWLEEKDWDIALTLNFAAGISRQSALRAAKYYWQTTDVWLFGSNAVQRRNKRLSRVCFFEGEDHGRNWHVHAAVKSPDPEQIQPSLSRADFQSALCTDLRSRWDRISESGTFSRIEVIHDKSGWLRYISKDVNRVDCCFCTSTSHIID